MKCDEVCYSICDFSKEFIQKYQNVILGQNVVDAIIVDFINYFAATECLMDLGMYTKDLRDGKVLSDHKADLEKKVIYKRLSICRDNYDVLGIEKSIKRNSHMNWVTDETSIDNEEALDVINAFIVAYLNSF